MDKQNTTEPSIQPPKKPSGIFRMFKRILILFLVVIALLSVSVVIIGYCFQNSVKEFVVGEINKQVNTEIIVDGKDIDFTVIKKFPYASLDFKNVKALDAIQSKQKDTLFRAGTISFQFNLMDLFNKNYHIKKIEINDVDLNIRIDKKGNDNYHFWKKSTDTGSTAFSIALEKIVLKQIHVLYKDHRTKQNIDVLIKRSNLTGEFSNENYSLEIAADLFINQLKTNDTYYLREKNVHAEVALNVDNKTSSYKIQNTKIKIEDLLFEVVGNIITTNKQPIVNLGIKGKNMDIKSVLSLIPEKYKNKINDYKSDGEFYFNSTIQGTWSDNRVPLIKADFGIKNADITQVKDNIILHHVNLKGHYSNGNEDAPSELTLIPFSATID
nr:AsmA family protein [Bacteroidota bacterium]